MMEHPLQQTLWRVEQLSSYIKPQLGLPDETGWLVPAALLTSTSTQLTDFIAVAQNRLRTDTPNMVGSLLLQSYQWSLAASAIGCYLFDRRVPDLSLTNVRFHLTETYDIDRIAYLSGRFTALPDDPAAAHPEASIVADIDALRDHLRHGLETHFGPVIDCLHERVGSHPRGLWLTVADRCAGDIAWLMQRLEPPPPFAMIDAEVKAFIQQPGSPLRNKKIGLFELTYQETCHTYLDRATCCYWYKMEDGDYCTTCPHRTREDRNERLLHYMAEEYAETT